MNTTQIKSKNNLNINLSCNLYAENLYNLFEKLPDHFHALYIKTFIAYEFHLFTKIVCT